MNNNFKIKFNPIVFILRIFWVLAVVSLLVRILYVTYNKFESDTERTIWVFVIGTLLTGTFLYIGLKGLIKQSKIYNISREKLIVTDLIRLKTISIEKEKIKGFSESEIRYRIGTFKQIIIYLTDNKKFEILQYEQFNFKKIKPILIEFDYHYFGFEPYQWKFLDSRIYHYE